MTVKITDYQVNAWKFKTTTGAVAKKVSVAEGLWLVRSRNDVLQYVLRYSSLKTGKRREMGMGSYPSKSLADAAAEAETWLAMRSRTVDCHDAREAKQRQTKVAEVEASPVTLAEAFEAYLDLNKSTWKKNGVAGDHEGPFRRYVAPHLGLVAARDITVEMCGRIFTQLYTQGYSTSTVDKAVYALRAGLQHAVIMDSSVNPSVLEIAWLPFKARAKSERAAERPKAAIHYAEARVLYHRLARLAEIEVRALPTGFLAHQFLLMTTVRTANVENATWDQIDYERRMWVIKRADMKASKRSYNHEVPLTDAHFAILAEAEKHRIDGCDIIFRSKSSVTGRLSANTFSKWLRENPILEHMTDKDIGQGYPRRPAVPHGHRTALVHFISERLPEHESYIGDVLDHKRQQASATARYDRTARGEKLRPVFEAWTQHLTTPVDNVASMEPTGT